MHVPVHTGTHQLIVTVTLGNVTCKHYRLWTSDNVAQGQPHKVYAVPNSLIKNNKSIMRSLTRLHLVAVLCPALSQNLVEVWQWCLGRVGCGRPTLLETGQAQGFSIKAWGLRGLVSEYPSTLFIGSWSSTS